MINYHLFKTKEEYVNAVVNLISDFEGQIPTVRNIGDGMATIGYGYTFNRSDNLAIWTAAGINLSTSEKKVLQKIDAAPANQKSKMALSLFKRSITKDEARQLLKQTYTKYEGPATALAMPISDERAAFVSITYNRGVGAVQKKMGPFYEAIQAGNRAEAWYQIRYNAQTKNPKYVNGIAKRRYGESYLFHLYDPGAKFTDPNEAKEVMRMFTRHELFETDPAKKISTYEQKYPPSKYGYGDIDTDIKPAQDYLISQYGHGTTIDGWVIVGRGLDSYQYIDKGDIADNIIGCSKNDLIFGEKGNDILTGGKGDDILYGGAGNDTYYINTGDGVDRIEDKDPGDRVIVNGHLIGRFGEPVNGIRKTDDGLFSGEMKGIDFVVTEIATGTKVILNENFQEGDFGIYFVDTPNNPDTGNVINGDLKPLDTDPLQDGVQIKYDEWGNLITDPSQPDPGRIDTLRDTSGNDLINGGAGDDEINARWGGENWIKGGDGNDVIDGQASTNCILEGGSGSDIIFGSYVSGSQMFGDSYGEMETLIAEGETAQGTNEKGDLIASGVPGGNDFIYGSNGNDALLGFDGKDLIVGGGGDDIILSDFPYVVGANPGTDWSATVEPDGNNYNVVFGGVYIGEQVTTGGSADEIYAGAGNDFVLAGAGDDAVYAGTGEDIVFGEAGNDFIDRYSILRRAA